MSKDLVTETRAPLRALPKRRGRFLAILLSFVALLLAPGHFITTAQQASQTATSAAARNAALIAATQEVLQETSQLRQLSILRPVQSSTQSRAEIQAAVIKDLDQEMSPADIHANEVLMKKLGLAPADFQYRALLMRLLSEQVAGYYEPKTQQFHLADWIDIDGQKPIMAHELTHALQDQHFNLRRFEHWPKGDSDAELATHSLIEGDATLAMVMYVAGNPLRALSFLKSMVATGIATEELDKAPRAVRESLLFPYQEGLNWTRALYKQGGWTEVSQAFAKLPQSTEQIMHTDKYFAHEAPVKVTLPDVTSLLNKSERPAVAGGPNRSSASWKRIASDVNGEWGFYLILDQFLKAPAESRRAAAGWGGDRFDLYESGAGEVVYISSSIWDTEDDAREFFDAYIKRTQLRYPNATPISDNQAAAPNSRAFHTEEGTLSVTRQGSRVLVVEGLRDYASVQALLRMLMKP